MSLGHHLPLKGSPSHHSLSPVLLWFALLWGRVEDNKPGSGFRGSCKSVISPWGSHSPAPLGRFEPGTGGEKAALFDLPGGYFGADTHLFPSSRPPAVVPQLSWSRVAWPQLPGWSIRYMAPSSSFRVHSCPGPSPHVLLLGLPSGRLSTGRDTEDVVNWGSDI